MKVIKNKVIFDTPEDWRVGLLRYHEPPEGKKFIFIFPDEEVRIFHTTGMEFNIDIHFYDANKKLVKSYRNCKPNIKFISSEKPAKYVVEIPSVGLQERYTPRDLRHPLL